MDHVKTVMDASRDLDRADSDRLGLDVADRRESLKGMAIEMDSYWKTPRPDDERSRNALSDRLMALDGMLAGPNLAVDSGLDEMRRLVRDVGAELHLGKAGMKDPRIREIAGLAWEKARSSPVLRSEVFSSPAKGPRVAEPMIGAPSIER